MVFKIIDANQEADLEAEEMTEGTTETIGDDQDLDLVPEEETVTVIAAEETDQGLARAGKRTQDAHNLVHPVEAERELEEALLLTREALPLLIGSLSKIQAGTPRSERLSRIIIWLAKVADC